MLLGMIADGLFFCPYLRVLRVFLFQVCMLCFIVTFHVTTLLPSRCRLNTSVLCSPQAAQMHTFQSTSESTFRVLSGLEHATFAEKRVSFTNRSARVVAIDTHNLRDPQSSRPTLSE